MQYFRRSLLVATLAYFSVTFSMAQTINRSNPALAHQLAPYNGRITAAYSAALSSPQASAEERSRADELARLALRQDPTAVAAVATLGIDTQVRNDTSGARRLFAYAQKLSRRDLRTQLWSIEDAVARENIPEALRWYDIALRTNPQMDELLFPILVSAGEDPAIRGELIRTLSRKPRWGENFVVYAAGNSPDPRLTVSLFQALPGAGVTVPESAKVGVIDALLRKRYFDEAWNFYASMRRDVSRLRSRDVSLSAEMAQPTQFDWAAVDSGDVTTSLRRDGATFAATSEVGGSGR